MFSIVLSVHELSPANSMQNKHLLHKLIFLSFCIRLDYIRQTGEQQLYFALLKVFNTFMAIFFLGSLTGASAS